MSTSIPVPGQHLPGPGGGVDPAAVHCRIATLLDRLDDGESTAGGEVLARQAQILELAHDVLVESLAAVDRV